MNGLRFELETDVLTGIGGAELQRRAGRQVERAAPLWCEEDLLRPQNQGNDENREETQEKSRLCNERMTNETIMSTLLSLCLR